MEENNNFLYKGYLLVIDVGGEYLSAKCRELKYDNVAFRISTLKNDFMTFVDEKLEKEKEMSKLSEKEVDRDVELVNQFIEAQNKVLQEMEPLVQKEHSGYILTVKLKRIYEEYKDTILCLTTFESYRTNFIYKLRDKEKEKVESMLLDVFKD